ncbi:MAG: alpha/beta hydrolase [Sciscionella sp.]|nr:alpha/beta hydrolase [Sciscionella sp.]
MIEHLRIPTPVGEFDAIADGPVDGDGVLLLHGFPEAAVEWTDLLPVLAAAEFRAIAVDQRGYSEDVRPSEVDSYAMPELVSDVLAIADSLDWQRFHLVGHDWGAAVAWVVAAEHADRVRSLTAVSVPHPEPFGEALRTDPDQRLRSAYMQVFRRTGSIERRLLADDAAGLRAMYQGKVPAERVDEYVARLSQPGALTAALNWYRAMPRRDATNPSERAGSSVGAVTVPTLYVWSTADVAVGSVAALATEKWVRGPYRFEMFEDVSHWVPEEAGRDLATVLIRHLLAYRE